MADTQRGCCAPTRQQPADGVSSTIGTASRVPPRTADVPADGGSFVSLPGGSFLMGSEDPGSYAEDGEGPVREVVLSPFEIDAHTVTNDRFARFVDATAYRTEAETVGSAFVFAGLLPDDFPPTRAVVEAPWWRDVEGADWRHPEGPHSDLDDRSDHPVVQVSWHDAVAYCAWAGARLPTEAQWEYAARGGLVQQRFPWGSSLTPGGEHRMNVFQGTFPTINTTKDGYAGTAPASAYPPNAFGLHNMTGNVWEWTADRWSTSWHTTQVQPLVDPQGPGVGDRRALRGGSYLCHVSYCWRYRNSARMGTTPDSPSGNVGFRCARDPVTG